MGHPGGGGGEHRKGVNESELAKKIRNILRRGMTCRVPFYGGIRSRVFPGSGVPGIKRVDVCVCACAGCLRQVVRWSFVKT